MNQNIKQIIRRRKHLSAFQVILLGFFAVILAGAVLLTLPVSSNSHQAVPFVNALFTSTSAVCVTGLIVYDTATQWSLFGRTVIILLIQIGGLGVVTMAILMMLMAGKRIGIFSRIAMQDAISAPQLGGIIRFTRFFLMGTFTIETIGALLMYPTFAGEFGPWRGIGYAVFHSISAFCNAGFDLMGFRSPFSSLTYYVGHVPVNLVICGLIILGGLGYSTWEDLLKWKFQFKRLRLQSKIILTMTALLIIGPFLYFLFYEFTDMPMKERILASLFQAVTPRTAGFNTIDYSKMSESGILLTIVLMMIGAAPGSTAGGMKVTTMFVLYAGTMVRLRRGTRVNAFHRRIDDSVLQDAFTILIAYMTLLIAGTMIISHVEHIPALTVMFECASALGTVGLTMGITPGLGTMSKLLLTAFMFFGRVGGITIAYAIVNNGSRVTPHMPMEKVSVG